MESNQEIVEEAAVIESTVSDGEDMYEHYTITATRGQKPMRLDKFLACTIKNITRSRIKSSLNVGTIMVNDKPTKKLAYKVKPQDQIKLLLPYPPPPELSAENLPIDIRYEDDDLMVIHKQPNVVCHPGIGNHTGTLVHGLLWHFEHLPQPKAREGAYAPPRPGLVHRLDKDTTGIMVVAKQEYAMSHLAKQFFDRSTDRRYNAIVWGDVKEDEGTVIGNIGRSKKDRKLFMVYPDGDIGKHAVTHYRVLERFGVATLVECKLETGRTHQIRVHMKYIGHTLIGDWFYGGDKQLAGPNTKKFKQFVKNCLEIMPRQALHARTLTFEHPRLEKRMSFDSDLPEDFQQLIAKLRDWAKHHYIDPDKDLFPKDDELQDLEDFIKER